MNEQQLQQRRDQTLTIDLINKLARPSKVPGYKYLTHNEREYVILCHSDCFVIDELGLDGSIIDHFKVN